MPVLFNEILDFMTESLLDCDIYNVALHHNALCA